MSRNCDSGCNRKLGENNTIYTDSCEPVTTDPKEGIAGHATLGHTPIDKRNPVSITPENSGQQLVNRVAWSHDQLYQLWPRSRREG